MGYPNLAAIYDDVEQGLQSQQHRLNDAAMAQAFWDYQGKRFMQVFLRDAETPFDYVQRPYRISGLLRQIITILCEHLYSPGPSRTWDQPAGQEFLQKVYSDNHFDSIMQRADQLSTLNDVTAVQVDADEGNFQDKPITLRLWGGQDFHVWCDPDNRCVPKVCCTIDRFDHATRYRVWDEKEVAIFETTKQENLEGGRTAEYKGSDKHGYGCLPFEFVHCEQPITSFWETGYGGMLTQCEIRANDRLSRLDESINKHLNPIPIAQNVGDDFQLILEPQRFVKIAASKMRPGPSGGYEDGPQPLLYYLEAHVDIAGAWDDLLKFINQVLQALKIPAAIYRAEAVGLPSGIALVVEQAPLLTRCRARRKPFAIYETAIARCILRCAGNHYKKPVLVTAAQKGSLALGWPQPSVPVPTQDNLDLGIAQVTRGIKSLVMLCQEWYGVDREQAFGILEQVEADNEELKQRAPTIAAGLLDPEGGNEEGGNADDRTSNSSDDSDKLSGADEDNQSRDMREAIVDL